MPFIQDSGAVAEMSKQELVSQTTLQLLFSLDDAERERVEATMLIRAEELGIAKYLKKAIQGYSKTEKRLVQADIRNSRKKDNYLELELDAFGRPAKTFLNFLKVIKGDSYFDDICYNELTNSPEIMSDGVPRKWTDTDEVQAEALIEEKYKLRHHDSFVGALSMVFRERAYHPIKDLIESITWDGSRRIEGFLAIWMRTGVSPLSKEISRLIFHGGINRLYNPGCKFDEMPVLIGTKQGEGKSTLVNLLAMRDEWFTEVTEFDGQKGVEVLSGKWICEVSELLALTKTKEQEAVKAYLTRKIDTYRKPYDKYTIDIPRQCIFIGTTNKEQFLTDKTGNRRFLPIKVDQNGYFLHQRIEVVKEYIRQCWAEALHDYREGKAQPFINPELLGDVRAAQRAATEEDWREGAIEAYLADKTQTCILDLWENALGNASFTKPSKKDSNEIGLIMQNIPGWTRIGTQRMGKYGAPKCWGRDDIPENLFSDIQPLKTAEFRDSEDS